MLTTTGVTKGVCTIVCMCDNEYTTLTNTYHNAAVLFIDGNTLWSREGTTQGDLLAMPMYAISLVALIRHLSGLVYQIWYADDAW